MADVKFITITPETDREIEVARYFWGKGWNAFMKLLPELAGGLTPSTFEEGKANNEAFIQRLKERGVNTEEQEMAMELWPPDKKFYNLTFDLQVLIHQTYMDSIMKFHKLQADNAEKIQPQSNG